MSKNTSKESKTTTEIVVVDTMPVLPVMINGALLTSENHAQVGMELTRLFRGRNLPSWRFWGLLNRY